MIDPPVCGVKTPNDKYTCRLPTGHEAEHEGYSLDRKRGLLKWWGPLCPAMLHESNCFLDAGHEGVHKVRISTVYEWKEDKS